MQLAEMAKHVLRAELDRAGAPAMQPGGPAGHDLQRLRRRARRSEHGERVGLHVEGIRPAAFGSTSAAPRRRLAERAAHAGRGGELVLRLSRP